MTDNYESRIGTDPGLPGGFDTDNDGFSDGEEELPSGVEGFDIAALNADPTRPDIFVEIDWFELAGDHDHAPSIAALQRVAMAFDDAPVTTFVNGVAASTGITLHVDAGSTGFINLPVSTPLEGNAIAFQNATAERDMSTAPGVVIVSAMTPDDVRLAPLWPDLEQFKTDHFGPPGADPGRSKVFHYSLWVHRIHPDAQSPTGGGLLGLAEGVFTDDFIVGLIPEVIDPVQLSPDELEVLTASVFMHELGHTLNLRHGGNESFPGTKPNYRSVMNNRYAFFGVDRNCDGIGDANDGPDRIDYSDEVLATLNEQCLNETTGICRVLGGTAPCFLDAACFDGAGVLGNCVGVDWNSVNGLEPNVQFNLTEEQPPEFTSLTGWDDWNGGAMRFDFRNQDPTVLMGPPDSPPFVFGLCTMFP